MLPDTLVICEGVISGNCRAPYSPDKNFILYKKYKWINAYRPLYAADFSQAFSVENSKNLYEYSVGMQSDGTTKITLTNGDAPLYKRNDI